MELALCDATKTGLAARWPVAGSWSCCPSFGRSSHRPHQRNRCTPTAKLSLALGGNTGKSFSRHFSISSSEKPQTYNSQVSPIQQVAKTFSSVALNDALATVELREVEHVLCKLLNGVLESYEPTVDDVDAVGLRIGDVFLHEAPETGKVGGDARNAHHSALGGRVAPRLVVRWENAWNGAGNK